MEENQEVSKRNAKLDRFWTSVAQESAWIRTCTKHQAKCRPKTDGNVASLREENAVFFFRPGHKNGVMNSVTASGHVEPPCKTPKKRRGRRPVGLAPHACPGPEPAGPARQAQEAAWIPLEGP